MKTIVLVLSMLILGCSSNDKPKEEPNNIPEELIGKWKIIEEFQTDGGNDPQWIPYETTVLYDYWFKDNGEYLRNDGTIQGSFVIDESNYITFTNYITQNSDTDFIEYLVQDTLIIDRLNFEPSKSKFIKINAESE